MLVELLWYAFMYDRISFTVYRFEYILVLV